MGMSRPVHVLQRTATVEEIVNVAAIAVVDAQENDTYAHPHVHVSAEPELMGEDWKAVSSFKFEFKSKTRGLKLET